MSSSDKSTSNKPQIFINHVDLSITKEDIQKACEEKNTVPTSVTIRNNHDQKSNNVNITFASENEAKILKGTTSTLTVKGIELKLEEYQTIYSSNIFLKNVHNLTEDQLQEGIRALVKGTFHFTTNFNQVYIYVKEEEDVNTLINKEHKIQGKDVRFEKFQQKKQQTQLYIKFATNPDVKPIEQYFQSTFGTTVTHTSFTMKEKPTPFSSHQNTGVSLTFSVTFTDNPKAANEFYNQLKTAQTFLNHPVTVSWKRPENSDDRTLFLKFLKDTVTEQIIRETFSTFGEVQQLDLQDAPVLPNKPKTKCAYLMMASEQICNAIMESGFYDAKVKELFISRPSICPYIPKGEMNSYKNATNKTSQNQMVFNQNYQQMAQFTQQYPPQYMNMNMIPSAYPMQYGVHQQRKPGYYVQHPQNQFMNNFQQQPKYKQRGNNQNRGNGNYQNFQNQGYNNNNNNYIQNNNNQHQHRHQHQHAAKQEFTKAYFQQLLQTDAKKFDEVILHQISKKIVNKLNSDKKYEKYATENLQQIIDMLTDKEVFEANDLIELFFDEADMTERIEEAVQLLIENAKQ